MFDYQQQFLNNADEIYLKTEAIRMMEATLRCIFEAKSKGNTG
jgi:hypothetical protein